MADRVRVTSFIDARAVHEVVRFLADRCDGATPNNRLRQSRFVGLKAEGLLEESRKRGSDSW